MSRLGFHVKTGPRNDYGEVCVSKPALVFSTGEGGALIEAKDKSEEHTWTFYRDIKHYDGDPGLNNMTIEQSIATAEVFYPLLVQQWLLNPADYYAVLTEPAGNDPRAMDVFNAYERRMMELAEPDGFKLVVCNLFSGTPDDGSVAGQDPTGGMETWKTHYGDHIARAFEGGHIYGRHVYGFPNLVPLDYNSDRPFREAEWLNSQGLFGGIALTELGLNGGWVLPPEEHMMSQIAQYDAYMRSTEVNKKFIIGGAWWTYGDWGDVNIQGSSSTFVSYLDANPSPAWTPPEYVPPTPQQTLEQFLWAEGVDDQATCGIRLNDEAGLEAAIKAKGLMPVQSEFGRVYEENGEHYVNQAGEDLLHIKPREHFVYQPGIPIWSFTDPTNIAPGFKLEVWPAPTWKVTQHFGEDPQTYSHFCDGNGVCLQGHNGWDMAAPMGSKIVAAVGGQVVWVSDKSPSGGDSGYGWHVRVQTGDYLIIYGHLAANPPVQEGQLVSAGDVLGFSGNTGFSTGPHLHFEMRKCPGLPDWPWCTIDPTPFLEEVYDPPSSTGISMRPYFRPVEQGVAPFFVLQHKAGSTEDIQVQVFGESVYIVKNRQYEHLRIHNGYVERREDTSRGNDTLYILDDGWGWSRWCPEVWSVGDTFYRNPLVRVMDKQCNPISNDQSGSWLRFDRFHPTWTSPPSNASPQGISLEDVVELSFSWSPEGDWLERYFIAPGLGPYCEWMNDHGDHSWISEIPQGREPLQREVIHCLS